MAGKSVQICETVFKKRWFLRNHDMVPETQHYRSVQICGTVFKKRWFLRNHHMVPETKHCRKHCFIAWNSWFLQNHHWVPDSKQYRMHWFIAWHSWFLQNHHWVPESKQYRMHSFIIWSRCMESCGVPYWFIVIKEVMRIPDEMMTHAEVWWTVIGCDYMTTNRVPCSFLESARTDFRSAPN